MSAFFTLRQPCTAARVCNKPTYTIDARGKRTDYDYDDAHGGVTRVRLPAADGSPGTKRPETRYTYTALQASYRNGSGTIIQGTPVYKLTGISQCRTGAVDDAPSCIGTTDETRTTLTYDANNALLQMRQRSPGYQYIYQAQSHLQNKKEK